MEQTKELMEQCKLHNLNSFGSSPIPQEGVYTQVKEIKQIIPPDKKTKIKVKNKKNGFKKFILGQFASISEVKNPPM